MEYCEREANFHQFHLAVASGFFFHCTIHAKGQPFAPSGTSWELVQSGGMLPCPPFDGGIFVAAYCITVGGDAGQS